MAIDFAAIRALPLSAIVRRDVKLARHGDEFLGLCPFHRETTPSFFVNDDKGCFNCFGCGIYGDHLDYICRTRNVRVREAAEILLGEAATLPAVAPQERQRDSKPRAEVICPVPADAPEPPARHPRKGAPVLRHEYFSADGELLGYVCRFDDPKDKIRPLVYTSEGWDWLSLPRPRPLYGLDRLALRPDAPVLVVEGEKAADAAGKLLPAYVAVTWPGGTNAVKHADWSPLKGRKVLIWPDADEPGRSAGDEIAGILHGL